MKKKSLLAMVVSLTLVATVGVGATLAYMSSTTAELTNTFTVGAGIEADLTEVIDKEGTTDDNGFDYTDIQPGEELVKEPYMTIIQDSSDCYAFMMITGADALEAQDFAVEGFNTDNWVKVADVTVTKEAGKDDQYAAAATNTATLKDGVYQYIGAKADTNDVVLKSATDVALEKIFTTVTYSADVEEVKAELSDIKVIACAVQAKGLTAAQALTETVFNK